MEMLLMIICMSIFGLAVTALAFGAATRPEREAPRPQPQPVRELKLAPTRFFAHDLATPIEARPQVPIEVLLLQLESHVRLEHAAAESFLESPTSILLQSKTASPFLN